MKTAIITLSAAAVIISQQAQAAPLYPQRMSVQKPDIYEGFDPHEGYVEYQPQVTRPVQSPLSPPPNPFAPAPESAYAPKEIPEPTPAAEAPPASAPAAPQSSSLIKPALMDEGKATRKPEEAPAPAYAPAIEPTPVAPVAAPIEERAIDETVTTAFTSLNKEVEYSGSVEAGLQYSTGNTETQDFNAAAELVRDSLNWTNRGEVRFANSEANGEQTEEEYRAELGSDYKFSEVDFLFGEAEYVDDRFSGYDYRIKEVLGYGRKWYNQDDFKWSSKAGGGYQHISEIGSDREDDPLARLENDFEWKINDKLELANNVQADFSSLTAVRTESYLKNQLIGSLFLKFSVITDYLSDVPAENENWDIDTLLNLAYEY